MNNNILVVDDDEEIRTALKIYLSNDGLNVILAKDGRESLEILEDKTIDIHLIVLDIMMPRLDGIQAILKIRQTNEIPIIIISAKSEDYDIVLGLNIGADDYITKPFNLIEVSARIKSNLRRYTKYETYKRNENEIIIRGLYLNKKTKAVAIDEKEIRLTPIEFKILQLLMENKGITFSIREIYEEVWNESFCNSENTVSVHIRRIREKIEINPKEPSYLKVVWGIGYKIEK